MRTFLICRLGVKEWIMGEILAFDRETQMLRIKLKDGMVRSWVFNPKGKYARQDYRIATIEDDDA